tara:strand:+ start:810 stop:1217 length:408 start_codon:yes stop_codon:yes gene_type:complete
VTLELLLSIITPILTGAVSFLTVRIFSFSKQIAVLESELSAIKQDTSKAENTLSTLHERVSKVSLESNLVKNKFEDYGLNFSKAVDNLASAISELRAELNKHKSDTNLFIKSEMDATKTVIMDKLELMMRLHGQK